MHSRINFSTIQVLDVSQFSYAERVCAAALQGLVNRNGPMLYLDYGIYDDPAARRTNEVFLDDELWYSKYRALLGNQDRNNLDYYQKKFDFRISDESNLVDLIEKYKEQISGLVIWDEDFDDTVNIGLMLAAQENLLPVTSRLKDQISDLGLRVKHDLRTRWINRVDLYRWAFDNLFPHCKAGCAACIEPGWHRPEFLDYVVQEKIFVYSLAASAEGLGSQFLLLLSFGPPRLREFLSAFRLDGLVRRFALFWMGVKSAEVKLSNRIQRAVKALPYPTIFGWHTLRDDELKFMFQLSANGLRLVPSHIAGNFSFHSQLPSENLKQKTIESYPAFDPKGIYLTFTLSDGDQLMMMHSGELGNWYSETRGKIPFNWETQPLLTELAPALLDKYISGATGNDCLIAGPSGAGYIVPPLAPDLVTYCKETTRICKKAGIEVVTTYVADPPARILKILAEHHGDLKGYLAGYAVVTRAPQGFVDRVPIIANRFPTVEQISANPPELFSAIDREISSLKNTPAFIGIHLFAYRTTYEDVVCYVEKLQAENEHIHVLRADTFLVLAKQNNQLI